MKKLVMLLALLFATVPAFAQTVQLGVTGGGSFGNLFAGPIAEIHLPVTKHVEIDLRDAYNPIEEHIALGGGWANQARVGGIVWLSNAVGINGSAEDSTYHVSISKTGEYAFGGVTLRKTVQGWPMRFTFDYVRQFNNGIDASGTETPRLQAGEFNLDMRTGCAGAFCFRTKFDFEVGHVLTQGNPVCDGTFGITGGNGPNGTCYRTGVSSGAFSFALTTEFPRRQTPDGY